jgi:hypothetical protein
VRLDDAFTPAAHPRPDDAAHRGAATGTDLEVSPMVVALLAWVLLSVVVGLVVGAAIDRADRMAERIGRPTRSEDGLAAPAAARVAVPGPGPGVTDDGFRTAA